MKIQLKPDAHPLKKRPDRLNPRIKDKAELEPYRMFKAGLIFRIE